MPGRLRRTLVLMTPPFLVAMGVLGLWYGLTYFVLEGGQRRLLPPAHEVVRDAVLSERSMTEILSGLRSTTQVTLIGLAVAIFVGMTLSVMMSQARWLERSIFPYAVVVQAVPIVAIVPVLALWFGRSYASRVAATVIIAFFPIVTNTLFGLKSAERNQHDLFTLHRATRFTRLRKLQFPAAMPAIFTGLRISAGLAVIGAIVGDFFFRRGQAGIGKLLNIYQLKLQPDQMIVAILLSSLLGLALFTVVGLLGHRVIGAWHSPPKKVPRAVREMTRPT
jgi:NitT/TauT family transport system permease protein